MKTIRIGTRASKLALIQAETVAEAIRAYDPELNTELVPLVTTGDKILNQTLDKIGGKGLFVKELDRALQCGEVDITVHSAKDLPMDLDEGLPIVATSVRADARDALVLPQNLQTLNAQKPVGCSSSRRRIQLQQLYPGMEIVAVRGNVITRLQKLDDGEFSALVLAAAGLGRLSLAHRVNLLFNTKEMLPAACQGILAVQARQGEDISYLRLFHSEESFACAKAERAFVRALDGGCSKPCAAYATWQGSGLLLHGMYVSDDESIVRYGSVQCLPEEAENQAVRMAERMKYETNWQGGIGWRGAGRPWPAYR